MVNSPQEAKTETKKSFRKRKLNGLVWNSICKKREAILAQIKLRPNQNRNSLTKEFVQLGLQKICCQIKVSQEAICSSIISYNNFNQTFFWNRTRVAEKVEDGIADQKFRGSNHPKYLWLLYESEIHAQFIPNPHIIYICINRDKSPSRTGSGGRVVYISYQNCALLLLSRQI